jgi:hypothetical protein
VSDHLRKGRSFGDSDVRTSGFYRRNPRSGVQLTENLVPRLPQNGDAERSILGAILLDNNAINAVIEKLKPEDFFHDHHRCIYQQMIALGETQQAIDLVTLTEQLQRSGELESVGGAAYVSQLMDGVPHITNVEHYARIVKEKSLLRGLIHAASAIQQQAFDGEEDHGVILARAAETISRIHVVDQRQSVEIYTAPQLATFAPEPVEYVVYPFAARGMVALLDGAAKAAGKTTLVLTAIGASFREDTFLNWATRRTPVLFVSEENPRTLRMAIERAGLLGMQDLHILPASLSGLPWQELAGQIERQCAELGIGWLVVDTFYAVAGLGGEEENKAGAVDDAVAPIRRIAGKLDIAVTLNRHTRKSGGTIGESGRGSSALTGAADIICELKRVPGSFSAAQRQLEVTGRIEQNHLVMEMQGDRYIIVPDEGTEDSASEAKRLVEAISANPKASKRELEEQTGIGRNRLAKIAAKSGWLFGKSGWEQDAR